MKIIAITFKTVCVGFLVFVLFVNIINAQVFDFESINSDSLLTHVPKGIAGGGIVKDSIWKNYVDNIKSGDVITDPYVLNKITKVSPYKGYAGSWLDNVIVYEKDGVKYEIGEKESGYLAVAHLVSDSMKVWEVPDSFKYNGKMCHVPLINARPDIDINSRKITMMIRLNIITCRPLTTIKCVMPARLSSTRCSRLKPVSLSSRAFAMGE